MDEALIKQRLIDLRRELLELDDTSRDAASTVELDQTRMGRLSRMDALQAQEISKEARRRRALLLRRIEPALKRLRSGDYGYCEDCDEVIATARLEFDPTCSTCIECASHREGS
ncbi:MAG: TraR/DksA family transcriptional regulator [Gammaproteobacteria bacterium]